MEQSFILVTLVIIECSGAVLWSRASSWSPCSSLNVQELCCGAELHPGQPGHWRPQGILKQHIFFNGHNLLALFVDYIILNGFILLLCKITYLIKTNTSQKKFLTHLGFENDHKFYCVFSAAYASIFLVGVTGNVLVVFVIASRNPHTYRVSSIVYTTGFSRISSGYKMN